MAASRNKIIELAKKRMPPAAIARTLGCKVDQVYSAIRWARSNGADIPHFRTVKSDPPRPSASSIVINNRLNSLLTREAERIGLSPSEMAQRLLETALLKTVGH
jgi:hypothetical protein